MWADGSAEEKVMIQDNWQKSITDTISMMFSDSSVYVSVGAATVAASVLAF